MDNKLANGLAHVHSRLQKRLALFARAVACEARAAEQERCARIAEGVERAEERHWVPGSLYDTLRRETAAEIRRKPDSMVDHHCYKAESEFDFTDLINGSKLLEATATHTETADHGNHKKVWTAGLFKGADGLQKLADADSFWLDQPYGTRLYFGDGIADYLHRDVLRAAVKALDRPTSTQTDPCSDEGQVDQDLPRRLFVIENGSNGAAQSGCEIVLDDVDGGNEERDYYLVSVVNGDPDVLKQMAVRLAACWDVSHGTSTYELLQLAEQGGSVAQVANMASTGRSLLEARMTALEELCRLAIGAVRDIEAGYPMDELAVPVEQLKARACALSVDPEA